MTGKEGPKFAVEPLDTTRHDRAAFYCEEEPLTKYLRERASQEIAKRVTAVYVITSDGKTIAGYYTLSQYTIDAGDIQEQVFKKLRLPKYKTLPATLLGRLARDSRFKVAGLGELLLMSSHGPCRPTHRDEVTFLAPLIPNGLSVTFEGVLWNNPFITAKG